VFDLPENQLTEPFKVCLVTDDSPIVRKIARRILRNLAFEVDEAENGRIALEKCEFLRSLRIMDGGGAPKVIVCTTESDVEHIREALETGADEYLMKPFDAGMLRTKLGCVISEGKSTAISASRP
jgi:two-component system, chemotaxis family, chemotaxis protein CheY